VRYILILLLVIIIVLGSFLFYFQYKNNHLVEANDQLNNHIEQLNKKVTELQRGLEIYEENQEIVNNQIKVVKEIEVKIEKEIIHQETIIEKARENNNCIDTLNGINELFNLQADSNN